MTRTLHRIGAALVACMTLLTPAWAKQRHFALPSYKVNPGTVVEVPLTLDNATGLAGLKVQVNFDPEVLKLVSVINNGELGQAFEMSYGKGDGFVRITYARAAALGAGSGRLATLKFRANSGATATAVSELAIADVRVIDATGVIDLRRKDTLFTNNGRLNVTNQLVNNPKVELPDWWAEKQTLTATPTTNGTISGLVPSGNYYKGQTVTLTAVPAAGYWFAGWTGNASGTANPLALLLDRNKTIGAKFTPILSNLTLGNGSLDPEFASAIDSYSVNVSNATKDIKVTPTLSKSNGTVKINGVAVASGTASPTIPLAVGQTTITVRAAAAGGAAKTYTIKVKREANARLSGLVVKTAALSPVFKPAKSDYTATVAHSTQSVKINATTADDAATLKINGIEVKSGTLSSGLPMKVGENVIKILVRAKDGTTMTYKITIHREKSLSASSTSTGTLATALGQDSPAQPNAVVSKTSVDGKRYLQIAVQWNPGIPKPVVEVSPDLVNWFSGNRHTTTVVDDGRLLIVRDNTPVMPEEKRFIRVMK